MSPESQAFSQITENSSNEKTDNGKDIILPADININLNLNISDVFKDLVTNGLGLIPYVGGILSGLVGFLWPPSGPSLWDQIKAEVEKMIDSKISDAIFSLLKAKLNGLGDNLQLYLGLIAKQASGETIRMQFIATNTLFVAAADEYENPDYGWNIGPLFAMFSVLHISLLRDCVLHGEAWEWPKPEDFQFYVDLAQSTLKTYIAHIDALLTGKALLTAFSAPTSPGQHRTDMYNHWQPFNQQKVVAFDDYRQLLIYLDPIAHPGPTAKIPFADVYTQAYGTADDWDATADAMSPDGGVGIPYGNPLTMIDNIYIEFFDYGPRVLNVQHKSDGPQVKGGDRVNQYGIITNYSPGVEKETTTFTPVVGRDFVIQKASLRSGSIPLTLNLILYDGSEKQLWDKRPISGGTWYNIEVEGRMLTTLNMWTLSKYYNGDLGCIIFGFSRDSQYVPTEVRDLLYVTSIHEPGDNRSGELDKKRTAYWKELKRRAEEKYPITK